MTTTFRVFTLAVLMGLASVAHPRLPTQVDGEPVPSLAPLIDEVSPAVVNIYSRTRVQVQMSPFADDPFFRRFFDFPSMPRERIQQSLGSGVIVDLDEGIILTNNHVINNAEDIAITLQDGRELNGELVGADPDTDLAVIQVAAEALSQSERVADLDLGASASLRVGDFVVAIGNPFGLGQTVTSGIVSALGRSGLRGLEYQNFIQTDASINPGNSGGALINLRGDLVGINTAIFTPSGGNVGIGFAVPVSTAEAVVEQLVAYGQVRRGSLGVAVQDIDDTLAEALALDGPGGVIVRRLDPEGSLAQAGVEVGDVVLAINGRAIGGRQDLRNIEGMLPVDRRASVELWRDGEAFSVDAEIKENLDERISGRRLDARLEGLMLTRVPNRGRVRGVVIEQVRRNTDAWEAGLRPGDLIVALNRRVVRDLADFRSRFPVDEAVLLLEIRRRGNAYRVPLRLDDDD
ncbi:MAG: Do family serine endopeptidase [Wenzhouxiangella sp.]|nr:Do family serine endopeptidase [Wenzhouxiangella sp.]